LSYVDPDGLRPEPGPVGPNIGSKLGNSIYTPPPRILVIDPEFDCRQKCQRDFLGITLAEEVGLHAAGHLVRSIARATPVISATTAAFGFTKYLDCLNVCDKYRCGPTP
jgi:hypothetical protein